MPLHESDKTSKETAKKKNLWGIDLPVFSEVWANANIQWNAINFLLDGFFTGVFDTMGK